VDFGTARVRDRVYSTPAPFSATDPRAFEGIALTRSRTAQVLLLLLGLSPTGCDRLGDIVIVAEFDLTYSFENGLEGWLPSGADLSDPAVTWSIDTSGDVASTGSSAARFTLDNTNGHGKIWLEREFDVAPERAYDVQITFDLASNESGDAWRVLAGAHDAAPTTAAELPVQDATAPGDGYQWTERSYTVRATSDDEGALFVLLGLWGTSQEARTYYVDNVHLVLSRVN